MTKKCTIITKPTTTFTVQNLNIKLFVFCGVLGSTVNVNAA